MFEIGIELAEAAGAPVFRLSSPRGETAKLLEIRVTEIGESEPSWRVVHEAAVLKDLVEARLISQDEVDATRVAELRFQDESLLERFAIPVVEFRYGQVPVGMRQVGKLGDLRRHKLYEIVVSGNGLGMLEFYA